MPDIFEPSPDARIDVVNEMVEVLHAPPLVETATEAVPVGDLHPTTHHGGEEPPPEPHIWVAGEWQIIQTNGYTVDARFTQNGTHLNAYCTHSGGDVKSMQVSGSVDGAHIDFTITWDNGTEGHYWGDLVPGIATYAHQGILKGTTQDNMHPESKAGWESSIVFGKP